MKKSNELDFGEYLTNEVLLKKFDSQFDLIDAAIRLAQKAVRLPEPIEVDEETPNLAFQILAAIASNKDKEIEQMAEEARSMPTQEQNFFNGSSARFNGEGQGFNKQARDGKEFVKPRKLRLTNKDKDLD